MKRELQLAIEELGMSGAISLGKCSLSTLYRWCRDINEILEIGKYEWRIYVDKKDMCLRVKED